MEYYLTMVLKLVISAVIGAFIGFEREFKNMPAGLRTNILVCVGSALVQIISIDIFNQYKGIVNVDPARLGAQVISGIGFLGAGTIIREGASVKGLTTAASLWVVACIGLAIGNGSYIPAVLAAVLVFITLRVLKDLERKVSKKNPYLEIEVQIENKPGQIGRLGQMLGDMNINIRNIEFKDSEDETITLHLSLKIPPNMEKQNVGIELLKEDGILSVEELYN